MTRLSILALALLASLALADQPATPDAWTEFPDADAATAAGWFITCGLSQQIVVDDDCTCGACSVGCQNIQDVWNSRFGLAMAVPLSGMQALRFQQRCTWDDAPTLDWNVFLTMQPTAAEVAAGYDLKQLHWTYPKTTEWTETELSVADAQWQWRVADSGMWMPSGGNTELTEMVALEWYWNLWTGLPAGSRKLIDGLAIMGPGTAVGDEMPPLSVLRAIYPNPANPLATVAIDVPAAGPVRVDVCDLRGRLVRRLQDGWLPAGSCQLRWDGVDREGRAAASGTYLVRVRTAAGHARGTVTLAR